MHDYQFSKSNVLGEDAEIRSLKEATVSDIDNSHCREIPGTGHGQLQFRDGKRNDLDDFAALLTDPRSSAREKLGAVEQLAKCGITNLVFEEPDGHKRDMRLELEVIGNRVLVHLFAADDSGRQRIVLRGVNDGKGGYERQKDSQGQSVDFHGNWWSANMPGRTNLALPGEGERNDRHRPADDRSEIDRAMDNFFYYLPDVELPDVPERGVEPKGRESDEPIQEFGMEQRRLNEWFDRLAENGSGKARRMDRTGGNAVYFRAGMAIDADGSPRARRIDPTGSPNTSLRYRDGRSVNAETENYIVLPMHKYAHLGIKKGDIAAVRHNGRVVFAVFADVGPGHKLGEGSMALARALSINNHPVKGGVSKPIVEYIVFPGSGDGRPGTNQRNAHIGAFHLENAARELT